MEKPSIKHIIIIISVLMVWIILWVFFLSEKPFTWLLITVLIDRSDGTYYTVDLKQEVYIDEYGLNSLYAKKLVWSQKT